MIGARLLYDWEMRMTYENIRAVCGDEVTKSKPDPQTFLLAAEKAGVPIEQCIIPCLKTLEASLS